jgi:L-iditol 2-dehydrogenase
MKALRKLAEGYNQMALVEVNEVFPSDGELKLRVIYTGICGSDIHGFKGEYNKKIPLTLGHEFVGEVVDIGHSSSLYKVGDIVVSETTFETCEKCSYCNEREYNLCSDRKGLGTQVDGSFADFVLVKEKRCHLIPKEIDNKIAAMLEPLACCIHAVKEKTIVSPNEKIVVFGPGPIGILLATVLKRSFRLGRTESVQIKFLNVQGVFMLFIKRCKLLKRKERLFKKDFSLPQ